jgi:hypothetical protein
MVPPAGGFACEICGKPLGARRVRQGIRSHSGCRRSLRPADVQAALGLAQGALARLPERAGDPELRALFESAATQARALIDDLQRLKSFVGGSGPRAGDPRAGEPATTDP